MRMPIRLLPEAKAEFDEAADWYEDRQAGLGVDFVAKIRDVLDRIAANPQLHEAIYGDVRKAVVRRFPYTVLYRADAAEVVVISVFHASRNPAIWQRRV